MYMGIYIGQPELIIKYFWLFVLKNLPVGIQLHVITKVTSYIYIFCIVLEKS